ncbi:hypothetical protein NWF34_12255 [Gordonia sp. GONU]|uniref:hypothetical protein n=1 Tax=Gordonia TaxID=2053 RepID=UPI00111543E5|nr:MULTISPECIES: hypothetical protein [unclassified Gordonia (in: high G+C Gram-positive bacteria)]MCR8897716.1 hypothetical protein [Gordonia sp. GONU]
MATQVVGGRYRMASQPVALLVAALIGVTSVAGCAAGDRGRSSSPQTVGCTQTAVALAERLQEQYPQTEVSVRPTTDTSPPADRGRVVLVGINNWATDAGRALGARIATAVQRDAAVNRVEYVLFNRTYWPGDPTVHPRAQPMEDRGSPIANHATHVRITTQPAPLVECPDA